MIDASGDLLEYINDARRRKEKRREEEIRTWTRIIWEWWRIRFQLSEKSKELEIYFI